MRLHNPKSEIHDPKSRSGVTLIEVLISMFIMAIGLMGILALFPMGALQMAQAVKDERSSQTAKLMEGHAKYLWLIAWTQPTSGTLPWEMQDEAVVLNRAPELAALDNANVQPNQVAAYVSGTLPGANYQSDRLRSTPSSPVYIDPIGAATQPGGAANSSQNWVGFPLTLLPRRSMSAITSLTGSALQTAGRIRICSLLDDLTFDTNGVPPPNLVRRAGDYNAGYIIQRQKNNVRTEVNLTVVVYRRRPPTDTYAPETPIGYAACGQGQREFTLIPNAGIPMPKVGTWLLALRAPAPVNAAAIIGEIQEFADFYRVVAVTQTGGNWQVELAQPVRNRRQNSQPYFAAIVQMENVIEVFDKGTLTVGDRPTQ